MNQKFNALGNRFDLLVVGGGIYGAWTALDAALRGLSVALVEKGDWGSGTSSASSKLIHGGLRYLRYFKLGLVQKSLQERTRLMTMAPHLVRPLRFVVPIFADSSPGGLGLKAGLCLYDFLARPIGILPGHQSLSALASGADYPFLKKIGLKSAATYWDAQTDDFRFTLEVVKAAQQAGVVTLNYTEAMGLIHQGNRVSGARVRDFFSGSTLNVEASVVVNAAGPWTSEWTGGQDTQANFLRLTKGVHLVMPGLPTKDALLIMAARDQRVFFMIPWYGRTLVGTTDTDYLGPVEAARVEDADIDYLLSEANRVFEKAIWQRKDIISAFAGLRALVDEPRKSPSAISREWRCVESAPGLFTSLGGKFTTARADAAEIVDRVLVSLGRPAQDSSPTGTFRFNSSPFEDMEKWSTAQEKKGLALGLEPDMLHQLLFRYGTAVEELLAIIQQQPDLASRLVADLHFCRAEIIHAVRAEMAVTLDDLMRRRLPLTILSRPDIELSRQVANLAAPVLGWNDKQKEDEINQVMAKWQSLSG